MTSDKLKPPSRANGWHVCIVGTGRVGLPLGLSLIEVGLKVTGLDIDDALRARINAGEMPFVEPGYDELIRCGRFQVTGESAVVAQCDAIIITVGTPLYHHIETDLRYVRRVFDEITPHLRSGHLICLRSTVAPGTTQFVKKWLEQSTSWQVGTDIQLAFCPERIAEGSAYEELRMLPQIIGSEDPNSGRSAEELFAHLVSDLMHTDFVSAELLKLFGNITRYIHFAAANQFALIADTFGADIHKIRQMANHRYPRTHIATPGMTGGTCLRKDFGMINEWNPYNDLLLSAWKINEYVPTFLVQHQEKRKSFYNQIVAVLGYSFKRNTDDIRDSLTPKLVRYVQRQLPRQVRISDHNLASLIADADNGEVRNWDADEACRDCDCVLVATNHSGYKAVLERLAKVNPKAYVVDIWNVGGIQKIFYRAAELADAK